MSHTVRDGGHLARSDFTVRTLKRMPRSRHSQEGRSELCGVQNLCWLMIVVDYTTQYLGDYNNPIEGSIYTNYYD